MRQKKVEISQKIREFIDEKKLSMEKINISDLTKKLNCSRQTLYKFYLEPFKDEIDIHNATFKITKDYKSKSIPSLYMKTVVDEILSKKNKNQQRKSYQAKNIDREENIEKARKNIIALAEKANKDGIILSRDLVINYLSTKYNIKPYLFLETRFLNKELQLFPTNTQLKQDDVGLIIDSLVLNGIIPTYSFIKKIRSIIEGKDLTRITGHENAESSTINLINNKYKTDFQSFQDLRDNAVLILEDNQPSLERGLFIENQFLFKKQ